MKIFSLIVIALPILLLQSCASLLTSSEQDVILISNDSLNLKVDTKNLGYNQKFNVPLLKNLNPKQVVMTKEGYKPTYTVLIPNQYEDLYYLSMFPFGLLMAEELEMQFNVLKFKSPFQLKSMRKYNKADTATKKLFIKNVEFAVTKEKFQIEFYDYKSFIQGSKPESNKSLDSIGVKYSEFDDNLHDVLRNINYIDTVNTVFIDNVNTYSLYAKVTDFTFYNIVNKYKKNVSSPFTEIKLITNWTLTNSYGDTITTKNIESNSGQFVENKSNPEKTFKVEIVDALENSMLNFIDSLKNENYLKVENNNVSFPNSITINKPQKFPTNMTEAINSTVTIKNKDGHGSGFCISNDGYIITNYHVVSKNTEYIVVMNDGSEFKAEIVRVNKSIDLALLKIAHKPEFAFVIPTKQNYNVGDEVIAIGTPKSVQLGQSISKGIVSGTRQNKGMNYLQNDIKVNRGNSGGPVVLPNGELTSVVEYKIFGTGVEGLSFSIPAFDILKSLNLSY